MMFSDYASQLHYLNLIDCQVINDYQDRISAIFSLVGIKYIGNTKYYMIAPTSHASNSDYDCIYSGANALESLVSRYAIDVSESDFDKLKHSNKIYNGDSLTEEDYPICRDGNYDEFTYVILGRFKDIVDGNIIVYFALANGELCSDVESYFIRNVRYQEKQGNKVTLVNASIANSSRESYLRTTSKKLYMPLKSIYGESSYLSVFFCKSLKLHENGDKVLYSQLDTISDIFDVMYRNYSVAELVSSVKLYFREVFRGTSNTNGTFSVSDWQRLERVLKIFMNSIPFVMFYSDSELVFSVNLNGELLKIYSILCHLQFEEDYPVKLNSSGRNCTTSYFSINSFYIDKKDDTFKMRCLVPSLFNTETIYYTLSYSFNTRLMEIQDVKTYAYDNKCAMFGGASRLNVYGKTYYALTGIDKYMSTETIDLSGSNTVNTNNTKLSLENLVKDMESFGYKIKSKQIIPDYAYMDICKSSWLNENEFVTLRSHTIGSKDVYQLDMYQNGKYYGTVSGDFQDDIILRVLNSKSSASDVSSVVTVPSFYADVYKKHRNLIYYDSSLFFTDYAPVYRSVKLTSYGDDHYTCAKFIPTGEYCICRCIKDSYSGYIDADIISMSGSVREDDYKRFKFFILVRFNSEADMFNAYTELFRKRDSKSNLDVSLFCGEYLGLSRFEYSVKPDFNQYWKDNSSKFLFCRCYAKYLGISQDNWENIFNVSDEVFKTMIFN